MEPTIAMRPLLYVLPLAALIAIAARSSDPFADIPFEHVIIGAHAPLDQWAIGVGDLNGDGQPDVVSSGEGPLDRGTAPPDAGKTPGRRLQFPLPTTPPNPVHSRLAPRARSFSIPFRTPECSARRDPRGARSASAS